jgi:hypothetical protein
MPSSIHPGLPLLLLGGGGPAAGGAGTGQTPTLGAPLGSLSALFFGGGPALSATPASLADDRPVNLALRLRRRELLASPPGAAVSFFMGGGEGRVERG